MSNYMITVAAISISLALPILPACQSASSAQRADKINWPRESKADGHTVVTYQPQVEKWKGDYSKLVAIAAISVKPDKSDRTVFGTIRLNATTKTDFESRMVLLAERKIVEIRFPNAEPAQGVKFAAIVKKALPTTEKDDRASRLPDGEHLGDQTAREVRRREPRPAADLPQREARDSRDVHERSQGNAARRSGCQGLHQLPLECGWW